MAQADKQAPLPNGMAGYGLFGRPDFDGLDDASCLTIALAWKTAMSMRNSVLGNELFVEPAWNLLLDLYIERLASRRVSVTGACVSSGVSQSTALRWLRLLEERGFVTRMSDPKDKRRAFIDLSEAGMQQMKKALEATAEGDRRLGLGRLRQLR
jgi:DNA-binding transcriptional ArsR family regulator